MKEKLREITLKMAEFAKKIAAEGDFQPMMHIISRSGEVTLATLIIDSDKDARRYILKKILRDADAEMYVLGTEAWVLALKAENGELPPMPDHPISQDDRRLSVLFFNGEDREGNCITAQYVIDEAHDRAVDLDNPMLFEEFNKNKPGKYYMAGVHSNLFDNEGGKQ